MTDPITAAREALADVEALVPAYESWPLRCRGGHWLEDYDNEDDAIAACDDRRMCGVGGCDESTVVEHAKIDAIPRSRSVAADHLRAALARVDELTAEVERLRLATGKQS